MHRALKIFAMLAAVALLISSTATIVVGSDLSGIGPAALLRGVAGTIAGGAAVLLTMWPRREIQFLTLILASAIFGARVSGMMAAPPMMGHSALAALELLPPIFLVLVAVSITVKDEK